MNILAAKQEMLRQFPEGIVPAGDLNRIAREFKIPRKFIVSEIRKKENKLGRNYRVYLEEPAAASVAQTSAPINYQGVTNLKDAEVFIPEKNSLFIKHGDFSRILSIIESGMFFPSYIYGPSGTGKTEMVEQACAISKREYIRVQISPETDEDDLIGGFRLINGDTVFQKGPVVKAMEAGAVLLIDEIDRGSNKLMCMQGVLEGKPLLLKKTGEIVTPKEGFTIFGTANTSGRGSDDGKFIAATILDEAFLERFCVTLQHDFPTMSAEKKILKKLASSLNIEDVDFVEKLCTWASTIRKTYKDGGIDDVISTRRLIHILRSFSIFKDKASSLRLCIDRFEEDTRMAFFDLYTKIDATVSFEQPATETETEEVDEDGWN